MINVASIRAAARATPGDVVGIEKAQLEQLLGEIEAGHAARRELLMVSAVAGRAGTGGVPAPIG